MRFSHTSITVRDMDATIAFYTKVLGLEFDRRRRIEENRAEIAFVKDPETGARIELTKWDDKPTFEVGEQLDHLAFDVPSVVAAVEAARAAGARVAKEPYRLAGGTSTIAFLLDPNDVWIELIERAPR
ncbi:MAG TPA: VOC family protein [Thermoplasmata archaeon]|jgi:lactoylglutathione lyase|nr:VOC family protein [Thermoplasmata archaeon]